jgi:hypothetical protein
MLGREQNELITLTGRGTPGGELMRRYWQPVALSEEVPADAPVPTRVLGEDLVLFRDAEGKPNLVGRRCPHRGVDLSYGRVEGGGLRCLYHGWLLAGVGRIVELIRRGVAERTALLVEHNLSVVADLSDRITVLARGEILADGPYDQVSRDPAVVEAYMGTADA